MAELWGKYHTTGITLLRHTTDVADAGTALFGTPAEPTRLGECWLKFFKLAPEQWARFAWNLLAAEWLHDWGKANDGMQRVLTGAGDQAIWHEHFSALLVGLPAVTEWLKRNQELDVPLVLSAVLTHHLRAPEGEGGWADPLADISIRLAGRDGAFRELVRATGERLGLGELDLAAVHEVWKYGGGKGSDMDIYTHRKAVKTNFLAKVRGYPDESKRLLRAVRSALIAADAAGSGYVRADQPVAATVWHAFAGREPWTGATVWSEVICKRVTDITARSVARGGEPFKWGDFQEACDGLPGRALLLAPCGSGKTLGAWRWIAARASERPVGRVLFLYPTRATAKEGFRDYVSWAPEADAALMHGNAAFDLRGMFDDGADPRHGSRYEADRRLYSLGYWPRRVFSATIDQFLSFLQYSYGSVCMMPVLADSVVVIDEVHSFDRNMLSALKAFLTDFDVPVLCMTATLPRNLIADLKDCGLALSDEIAGRPRYTLTRLRSRDEAFGRVRQALAEGKRVLWVANTVKRCHEIAARFAPSPDDLRTAGGERVHCYHSRFKLDDRVLRHNKVVGALKVGRPGAPGVLGVTTQVCEMSLDLDVDLLVTEECPVTSLIQRMGRCNRAQDARPLADSGAVFVYKPDGDNTAPYTADDLMGLDEFLGQTDGRELSQADLESTLTKLAKLPPWYGDRDIKFLSSGAYANKPRSDDEDANTFREGNDFNRPCVLPGEVDAYLRAGPEAAPGFVVPVPNWLGRCRDDEADAGHRRLPRHIGVAAEGHYHPTIGYCDKLLSEWGAE